MKKTQIASQIALALSLMAAGPTFANTFVNGGFEDGNLGSWTSSGGCWNASTFGAPPSYGCVQSPPNVPLSGNPAPVNPALFTGTHNNSLVGLGTDSITGASTVYGGNYAVRVNDSNNNWGVSTIKQSVTNYTDNSIFFAWNAVLESSHGLTDSDHFSLVLHNDTTGVDVVSRAYSSAGSIGAGTTGVTWTPYQFGQWFSSGWVVESIDLTTAGPGGSSIVGDDFTLSLLAADCPYGGHAGYVYLDGFGATIPTQGVPEPETLALLGLGLLGLGVARRRKSA